MPWLVHKPSQKLTIANKQKRMDFQPSLSEPMLILSRGGLGGGM